MYNMSRRFFECARECLDADGARKIELFYVVCDRRSSFMVITLKELIFSTDNIGWKCSLKSQLFFDSISSVGNMSGF